MDILARSMLFWILVLLSACGEEVDFAKQKKTPSNKSSYLYVQPNKNICDVTQDFDNGFLCAIKPSRLDASARDTYFSAGHTTQADKYYGFGYHVIVFPKTGTDLKGVYIHFKGSYGRPYSQDTGKFADKTFLMESATSGYLMIQPAYSNRYAINTEECGSNKSLDNCAGLVREDKISGRALTAANLAGTTIEDTSVADSIEQRLKLLVTYLTGKGFTLPVQVTDGSGVTWKNLRVGGHSQGSGHATYLAKKVGVEHLCILAGIHDTNDNVNNPSGNQTADWLRVTSSQTSDGKMKAALCSDDDAFTGFKYGLSLLGMKEGTHFTASSFSGGYFDEDGKSVDAHAAIISEPRFKADRAKACFQ